MSLDGAKGVLFNITGGRDLGMFEIDEAAKVITKNIDPDAKVKFGAVVDESLGDEIRITVIATGFEGMGRSSGVLASFEEPKKSFSLPSVFGSSVPSQPQAEVRRPLFTPPTAQPKSSPPPPVSQAPAKEEDEDELEIPAFIRKKMK
jgi:cell division protein FtsZ